ncbi:hypothetical protein L210DRAFT_3630197 [Boletus edulis BED1]|uniref:Uncharacterized protein n=1 Tax=Boletus edulis BED1 TaxID=1328754 RepID=A0AAD4BWX5_BOLED|nr:hypothetical protein L210DRAFT_3630197 [Boletus edulis BED1]
MPMDRSVGNHNRLITGSSLDRSRGSVAVSEAFRVDTLETMLAQGSMTVTRSSTTLLVRARVSDDLTTCGLNRCVTWFPSLGVYASLRCLAALCASRLGYDNVLSHMRDTFEAGKSRSATVLDVVLVTLTLTSKEFEYIKDGATIDALKKARIYSVLHVILDGGACQLYGVSLALEGWTSHQGDERARVPSCTCPCPSQSGRVPPNRDSNARFTSPPRENGNEQPLAGTVNCLRIRIRPLTSAPLHVAPLQADHRTSCICIGCFRDPLHLTYGSPVGRSTVTLIPGAAAHSDEKKKQHTGLASSAYSSVTIYEQRELDLEK